jgi:hypothetical protein
MSYEITRGKDKSKQTCFNNFGVECPMKSQEFKDKSKQNCIERYGVECPMKLQEVKINPNKPALIILV